MKKPTAQSLKPIAILAGIKRLSRRFTGFVLLVVAVLLALLMVITGPTAEPREQVERAWPVTALEASPAELAPILLSYGRVEAQQTASLNTKFSARVSRVLVREGDWVAEGDLLLELDATELQFAAAAAQARASRAQATLLALQAEFSLAEAITDSNRSLAAVSDATLSRALDLHSQRMLADAQLDSAKREASQGQIALAQHLSLLNTFPARIAGQEASVQEARAEAARAEFDLAQAQLRAPFDGRIISSGLAVGERVAAGRELVAIADYSSLEIRSTLPLDSARRLEQGFLNGEALAATAMLGAQQLSFPLSRIGGTVKTGQGGLDAFFAVDALSGLDIGAVVELALALPNESNVLALPIYTLYEDSTVYRIREQRLQALRYERVGDHLSADGEYLALVRIPDLQTGDQLLGSQLSRAITGLLVAPIETPLSPSEEI